jgi:hypothetical protein
MDTWRYQLKRFVLLDKVILEEGGAFVVEALELETQSGKNKVVVNSLEGFKNCGS